MDFCRKSIFFSIQLICCLFITALYAQDDKKLKPATEFVLKKIEPANFDKTFPDPPENLHFPKIKKYEAVLEKISPKVEFKSGTIPEITFRVLNMSFNRLVVPEWMMKEPYNIRLYYTPWEVGMKMPPSEKWIEIKPEVPKNPRRMTLDLKHRNSVLITTTLPFLKTLKIITPHDYLIRGVLNLTSLPLKSRVFRIRVNP